MPDAAEPAADPAAEFIAQFERTLAICSSPPTFGQCGMPFDASQPQGMLLALDAAGAPLQGQQPDGDPAGPA